MRQIWSSSPPAEDEAAGHGKAAVEDELKEYEGKLDRAYSKAAEEEASLFTSSSSCDGMVHDRCVALGDGGRRSWLVGRLTGWLTRLGAETATGGGGGGGGAAPFSRRI